MAGLGCKDCRFGLPWLLAFTLAGALARQSAAAIQVLALNRLRPPANLRNHTKWQQAQAHEHRDWLSTTLAAGKEQVGRLLLPEVLEHIGAQTTALQNHHDVVYLVTVQIGSPPSLYEVVLDTGSSDLWVNAADFVSSSWSPVVSNANGEPVPALRYVYGSCEVQGTLGTDNVCVPTAPGPAPCVPNQAVLLAQEVRGMGMKFVNGILGVGLPGIAHVRPTWLEKLAEPEVGRVVYEQLSLGIALNSEDLGLEGVLRSLVSDVRQSEAAFGDYTEVVAWAERGSGTPATEAVTVPVVPISPTGAPGFWVVSATVSAQSTQIYELQWQLLSMTVPALLALVIIITFSLSRLTVHVKVCCGRRPLPRSCPPPLCCGSTEQPLSYCSCRCGCLLCGLLFWFHLLIILNVIFWLVWNVQSAAGEINGERLVVLDTGTSLMEIPFEDFWKISTAMFGTDRLTKCALDQSGVLVCKCSVADTAQPLTLSFGGRPIVLTAQDLFQPLDDPRAGEEQLCSSGLGTGITPMFVLGDTFLRKVQLVLNTELATATIFPKASSAPASVAGISLAASGAPSGGLEPLTLRVSRLGVPSTVVTLLLLVPLFIVSLWKSRIRPRDFVSSARTSAAASGSEPLLDAAVEI